MIRSISESFLSAGIRSPTDTSFFEFEEKRSQGIFFDKYVAMGAVLAQTDEHIGFERQISTCSVQSDGVISDIQDFTPTARVSLTTDPDDISKPCWLLKCTSSDADTAGVGAKRTEFAGGKVDANPFTFGLAERLEQSWAGTTDEQIIFQVHGGIPISPILSANVNADVVHIYIRYGTSSSPKIGKLYSGPIDTSWDKWVVSGLPSAENGYITVSRNGEDIVSYRGPFGYSDYLNDGYIKCGYYHWTNGGNTWDGLIPSRGIYVKGFWQVDTEFVSHKQMVSFLDSV